MKKKIVRRMLLAILALGLLLGSIPAVLGAENLFDPENAFDELYLEEAEDRPGVFTNQNSANGSTGSETFCLPGLTKNYTFSGHIKILEIGQESWTGRPPDYRQRPDGTVLTCDYQGLGHPF